MSRNIKIFDDCEVRIENSVTMVIFDDCEVRIENSVTMVIFGDCEVQIENSVTMVTVWYHAVLYEPRHEKTNKISVRPAKTDQPGHPPSLIRVFAVRSMGS